MNCKDCDVYDSDHPCCNCENKAWWLLKNKQDNHPIAHKIKVAFAKVFFKHFARELEANE